MTEATLSLPQADPTLVAALADGAAWRDASALGRLRLTKRDRADLLHRLSTNDVSGLAPGSGLRTVITNHNARIVDLLTVYALPEHLLVTTSPGHGPGMAKVLQRNIFFQDQVLVEDVTATTAQAEIYGAGAAAWLATLTGVDPADWPLHHVQAVEVAGAGAWLARALPLGGAGFTLIAEADHWPAVTAALAALPALDDASYAALRVAAGYPAWGHELSLDYIPLEARLDDAVSFTKGCYVGQEIIARMASRGRRAKQLMALRLAAPAAPGPLVADGKEQGTLTSVALAPDGAVLGLGYVRTEFARPGAQLATAQGIAVEVAELPGMAQMP